MSHPLEDALALVTGDRNDSYGPAAEDYAAVAQIVSGMLRKPFTAAECAAVLIAVKLARTGYGMSRGRPLAEFRDSIVDGPGYWGHVLHECLAAEEA